MNVYVRILSYVKPYWYFMVGAICCMTCFALMSSATVWVALPFLQTLFGQETVQEVRAPQPGQIAVSYTHLTLPTSDLV